jgi:hypothetical protein
MLETAPLEKSTQTLKPVQVRLARAGVAPRPGSRQLARHSLQHLEEGEARSSTKPRNIPAPAGVVYVSSKQGKPITERMVAMSRLVQAIRSHREVTRTRRELNRAISNAATPSMRDELIMVAQRAGNIL